MTLSRQPGSGNDLLKDVMSMYTAEHLNLLYPDPEGYQKQVLYDIPIDIQAGECIGILGKSGGGKTQLVLALARLNEYRGGVVSTTTNRYCDAKGNVWDLKDNTQLNAFRKTEIAYIFQEPSSYFNPTLKIGKQITLAENPKEPESATIKEWFLKVGLEDYDRIMTSYPHQLSGGQLQRLAILACLIRKPRIVVADEITASLDPQHARLILHLLVDLKKELGFSLLWVTHDESEAVQYCNRIWVVDKGKIKIYDPVRDYPLNTLNLDHKKKRSEPGIELLKLIQINKSYLPPDNRLFGRVSTGHKVLKEVSMSMGKGEILGLVGPSGGGKSTLAKIIAGIENWDQGEIFYKSERVYPGSGMNKEIIYLFQDSFSSLNPQLSCRYLLEEALKAGRNRMPVADMLALAQLDSSILDKKAISLSGGLRQRFALARALAVNPEILIMDESVNALDLPLQKQILDMLVIHQKKTQMAILFISHQDEVVRQFTTRQVRLENGVLTPTSL